MLEHSNISDPRYIEIINNISAIDEDIVNESCTQELHKVM
jgi:hypothetical protein